MIQGVARKYFEGKTCIFCNNYGLYRLADKRVKCKHCNRKYSLTKLKRDMIILYYFYLEVSARKTSKEIRLNYKTIQSRFMKFRKKIAKYCNQEARKLNGELEIDESYFGGREKEIEAEEQIIKQQFSEFSREKARFTQLLFKMFQQKH